MPAGVENLATPAAPSRYPVPALPTRVDTAKPSVIRRILLLFVSATHTKEVEESHAMPEYSAKLKDAAGPVPSDDPNTSLPAARITAPVATVACRMLWNCFSTTKRYSLEVPPTAI